MVSEERLQKLKEKYKLNPELFKARTKKYYQNNKEKIKIRERQYYKIIKNTPLHWYNRYKNGAIIRNLPFNITLSIFSKFLGGNCSYCGDEIKSIGIDRIDSKKGYILGNMNRCCKVCNIMKLNYTAEFFINHCKKISKHK